MTDTPDLREQIRARIYEALPMPQTSLGWEGTQGELTRHNYEAAVDAATDAAVEVLPSGTKRLIETCNLLRDRLADTTRERDEARAEATEQSDMADDWCARFEAAEASRRDWAAEAAESEVRFQDLLGSIWLYVDWRYVTKQLTTEQKELWADAVDASGDPDYREPKAERWWRPRLCACGHDAHEHHVLTVGKIGCQVCECNWFLAPERAASVHPDSNGGAE